MAFRRVIAAVGVLLLSAGTASAQDYTWNGGAGDGLWTSPNNWNPAGPPPSNAGNIFLGTNTITIPAGETVTPGLDTAQSTIFGPDWGGTLNIYGTLQYNWYLAPVSGAADPTSNVNMYDNAQLSGEGIAVGYTWWINTAPNAAFNMYDNASATVNWVWWGGQINLEGGTLTINAGVVADSAGNVSDSTRLMNITDGTLVLGYASAPIEVQDWVNRGILQAYGGTGSIVIDTVSSPGQTIVTAVVPEPATGAVLLLGSLAVLLPRRCLGGRECVA